MSPLDSWGCPPHSPLRIALIVGTRPEAIKQAPIAIALGAMPDVKPLIWCTGQHAHWAPEMLAHFGLGADLALSPAEPGKGLTEMASHILGGLHAAILAQRPQVMVVQGDTLSAFAGALAAAYARVPIVHVEAGLRSDERHDPFPEEAHRRAIAAFTDLHCAPTTAARNALLAEKVPAADILLSGNTVIDSLHLIRRRASSHDRIAPGTGEGRPIIVVTCHRRENWGAPYMAVCNAAKRLAQRGDCDVIFVTHPNPALSETAHALLGRQPRLGLVPPLAYPPFLDLLGRATLVLTDSGGIQEEAAALGVPLLILRNTTERQEGIDVGVARLVGTDEEEIVATAAHLLADAAALKAMRIPCDVYGDGHAGRRIADAILTRWGRTRMTPPECQISASAAALASSLRA